MDDLVAVYRETGSGWAGSVPARPQTPGFLPPTKVPLPSNSVRTETQSRGFQISEFDPIDNIRTEFKLVLDGQKRSVERFMDNDPSRTPFKSLMDNVHVLVRRPKSCPSLSVERTIERGLIIRSCLNARERSSRLPSLSPSSTSSRGFKPSSRPRSPGATGLRPGHFTSPLPSWGRPGR